MWPVRRTQEISADVYTNVDTDDEHPRIWNDLPDGVHSAKSLSSFRNRLKTYIFDKAYYPSLSPVFIFSSSVVLTQQCFMIMISDFWHMHLESVNGQGLSTIKVLLGLV